MLANSEDDRSPPRGVTQRRPHAGRAHVVVDDRVTAKRRRSAGLDSTPGELGVLTRGMSEVLVETPEAFEPFSPVSDVAGLVKAVLRLDLQGAAERTREAQLLRRRAGAALGHIGRLQAAADVGEPTGLRLAVVVGEDDEGGTVRPPA